MKEKQHWLGRICDLIAPHLIIEPWNVTAKPHVNIARSVIIPQAGTDDKKTLMTANRSNEGILLMIPVKVDGGTCCGFIDTGAGRSYGLGKLIALLKKPYETKTKRVDMLMSSQVTKLEVYDTLIESQEWNFTMSVKLTKVHKGELLTVDNSKYQQLLDNHSRLKEIKLDDFDTEEQLPVHMVLGSGEYAQIKTGIKKEQRVLTKQKSGIGLRFY